MERLIIGVLSAFGIFLVLVVYILLKNMEGLKGKFFRLCFYIFIAACLCLVWLYSPEKIESFAVWMLLIAIIYYFAKEVLDQYFNAVEERAALEEKRYENIMKELDAINSRIDEIEKRHL